MSSELLSLSNSSIHLNLRKMTTRTTKDSDNIFNFQMTQVVKRQALSSNSSADTSNTSCTYSSETEVIILTDDFCSQPGTVAMLLQGPKGDPGPPGLPGETGAPGLDGNNDTNVSSLRKVHLLCYIATGWGKYVVFCSFCYLRKLNKPKVSLGLFE